MIRTTPVPVSGLASVTAIASGGYHSLALLLDGTIMAWGSNGSGQLGDGTTVTRRTPVPATGLTNVTAMAGGGLHSLALLSAGTVSAWRDHGSGQCGDCTL